MAAKNNAASDNVPKPPDCARPRILAKGVSISRRPVFAISPAMKAKVPCATSNRAEGEALPRANSFTTMRALLDRLKPVPSMKRISTRPSAAVSMMSPWKTESPSLSTIKIPLVRVTVADPVNDSILPTTSKGAPAGTKPAAPPPLPGATRERPDTGPVLPLSVAPGLSSFLL